MSPRETVQPPLDDAPCPRRRTVAVMARRLAEAIEDARLASDDDLGVASGLAWSLTDLLEMHGEPRA